MEIITNTAQRRRQKDHIRENHEVLTSTLPPPVPDPLTEQYYRQTFTRTGHDADLAILKFKGTDLYLYGAKRPNCVSSTRRPPSAHRSRIVAYYSLFGPPDHGYLIFSVFMRNGCPQSDYAVTIDSDVKRYLRLLCYGSAANSVGECTRSRSFEGAHIC